MFLDGLTYAMQKLFMAAKEDHLEEKDYTS